MSRSTFGTEVGPSTWPRRVIAEPELSAEGNLVIRIGREKSNGQTWYSTEHLVLTPDEAREYLAKLAALIPEGPE